MGFPGSAGLEAPAPGFNLEKRYMKSAPKLKLGDVVFVKEVQENPEKRCPKITFKGGWGFAMMLGVVAPFSPPPKPEHLTALMGQAGYISFDDVSRFLGKEQAELCVKKVEETVKILFERIETEKKKPQSKLVTTTGKPLLVDSIHTGRIEELEN